MIPLESHAILAKSVHDEGSRQSFVHDFRVHLASKVFPGNFSTYYSRILPAFLKAEGREPISRHEVRRVMTSDPYYTLWSAMQRNSQEMIWDSVIDPVERQLPELIKKASAANRKGSLKLDKSLEIPKYHLAADIHLQPGAYHSDQTSNDVSAGAMYDLGTYIYSMGGLGRGNNALGQITHGFFKNEFPEKKLHRVLDMGCTIGGSVTYWAQQNKNIEFHAIDVGAPVLRYGHARANALDATVHFSQQNAERTDYEDESFDLVMSHILLHETSKKAIQEVFNESYRLLKPGGIMMHLDLPQAHGVPPLEGFLFEWEIYNNNEHFYSQLRDMNLTELCQKAGFKDKNIHNKGAGSIWMEDKSPYADDNFEFPITLAIK
ncbi:MAG: methyltransferase type 12 [Rhodospirillaceae bacterium]|nr:methyltransferase type 12 [Rhodospirillaceae bacterium]